MLSKKEQRLLYNQLLGIEEPAPKEGEEFAEIEKILAQEFSLDTDTRKERRRKKYGNKRRQTSIKRTH